MSTLCVRVWPGYWGFESLPGEPFHLEKLPKYQQAAAAALFDKRYEEYLENIYLGLQKQEQIY